MLFWRIESLTSVNRSSLLKDGVSTSIPEMNQSAGPTLPTPVRRADPVPTRSAPGQQSDSRSPIGPGVQAGALRRLGWI